MHALILLSTCITALASAGDQFDPSNYGIHDVISRDVAVIGGGSSGTYAAINLRAQDKSVAVIERDEILGGHTRTWTDPNNGISVDYGLQAYGENTASTEYFALLDIPTTDLSFPPVTAVNMDFETGEEVAVGSSGELARYAEQLAKYPYLEGTWDIPSPVPEDLLLPFADFVEKYELGEEAFTIFSGGRGCTDILNQLTVNVLKMVSQAYLDARTGAAFAPLSGRNDEVYTKALEELGSDVLLSSTVAAAQRPSNSTSEVRLVVKTPTGQKLIRASKLLITAPPLVDNLSPFDLDTRETDLFSKWSYSNYFILLLNNTGLPDGYQYINSNASTSTYNIPQLPAPYLVTATEDPGIFYSWYGSPVDITQEEVEADVIRVVETLRSTTNSTVTTTPEIIEFRSHSPFKLVVSAEEITGGFYQKLEELQGHRNTWYTGAAFVSHDASVLWDFTSSVVLPDLLAK